MEFSVASFQEMSGARSPCSPKELGHEEAPPDSLIVTCEPLPPCVSILGVEHCFTQEFTRQVQYAAIAPRCDFVFPQALLCVRYSLCIISSVIANTLLHIQHILSIITNLKKQTEASKNEKQLHKKKLQSILMEILCMV